MLYLASLLAASVAAGGMMGSHATSAPGARGTMSPGLGVSAATPPTIDITSQAGGSGAAYYLSDDAAYQITGTTTGAVSGVTCSGGGCEATCEHNAGASTFACDVVPTVGTSTITVTVTGPGGSAQDTSSQRAPPAWPTHWLAARAETGTYANGASVSSWTDRGTAASNAVQATGGSQPIFRNPCSAGDLNELPCVRFDGVNDRLSATIASPMAQPNAVCMVTRVATTSGEQYMAASPAGNFTVTGIIGNSKWTTYAGSFLEFGSNADTNYHVICSKYDGATSVIRVDDSEATGAAGANATGTTLHLGSGAGDSTSAEGDLVELLWFDDGTIDRGATKTWLEGIYGAMPQTF
jgi:hypothetical protein